MNRSEFINDVAALIIELVPTIGDDYRAFECSDADETETEPSMLLTIGADADGWSYQTGDNSYSGGAYHYATWGLGILTREDSAPEKARALAAAIADEITELQPDDDAPIFDNLEPGSDADASESVQS